MSIVNMLFSPVGRIRRRDYWVYSLVIGFSVFGLNFLVHHFVFGLGNNSFVSDLAGWMHGSFTPFSIYIIAVNVLLLWPTLCLTAKRWHDRNRTGWLAPILAAVSYALSFSQVYLQQGGAGKNQFAIIACSIVAIVVGIWQFIECGCLDGTQGRNPYGPSPKARGNEAEVF